MRTPPPPKHGFYHACMKADILSFRPLFASCVLEEGNRVPPWNMMDMVRIALWLAVSTC